MSNIWTMKIRSPVTTTNQLFNENSVIMWFWFGLPNDDDINNIFHQLRIKNLTEIKKLFNVFATTYNDVSLYNFVHTYFICNFTINFRIEAKLNLANFAAN